MSALVCLSPGGGRATASDQPLGSQFACPPVLRTSSRSSLLEPYDANRLWFRRSVAMTPSRPVQPPSWVDKVRAIMRLPSPGGLVRDYYGGTTTSRSAHRKSLMPLLTTCAPNDRRRRHHTHRARPAQSARPLKPLAAMTTTPMQQTVRVEDQTVRVMIVDDRFERDQVLV